MKAVWTVDVNATAGLFKEEKNLSRGLSFSLEAGGEVPVSYWSDKSTTCGGTTPLPASPIQEGEDAPQREQHRGAVHTPSTGTNAIRHAHNGPTQVVQVAVCHVWRAAAEIDWEAFPKCTEHKEEKNSSQSTARCASL